MGSQLLKITAVLFSVGNACQAQTANGTLVFAPLPMEAPEVVVGQWKPLLTYVAQKLNIDIRIDYSQSNDEILEKFRAGRLDLAYLGPLPYLVLKEGFPDAVPVVHFKEANGQAVYTCAIVALTEKKLTVKKLHGKKIALTQPRSTCGYFAAEGLLRQAGTVLEANRYRYLNTHDGVALAVARGDFDAGVLKTAIGRKYTHLGVEILAETAPLPSLGLVANRTRLPTETIERLRSALVEADYAVRADWGDNIRHGVSPAADKDYDPMRKLRGTRNIPESGNF